MVYDLHIRSQTDRKFTRLSFVFVELYRRVNLNCLPSNKLFVLPGFTVT